MSWQRPSSELRASDAERERVVSFLREHALVGRLSNDELEDRIGAAYAAITRGDLEALIADLPRRDSSSPARRREARAVEKRPPSAMMVLVGLAALVFPMAVMGAAAVALIAVFAFAMVLGPFVIVALILIAAMRRRRPSPASPRRSVYG